MAPQVHIIECVVIRVWQFLREVKKWDLVGGSMSLAPGFGVSHAQDRSSVSVILLPADPDVEP